MKKLNELQSYLTRLRGLMLTLIILCSIGVRNVWGAEQTVTFTYSGTDEITKTAYSQSYATHRWSATSTDGTVIYAGGITSNANNGGAWGIRYDRKKTGEMLGNIDPSYDAGASWKTRIPTGSVGAIPGKIKSIEVTFLNATAAGRGCYILVGTSQIYANNIDPTSTPSGCVKSEKKTKDSSPYSVSQSYDINSTSYTYFGVVSGNSSYCGISSIVVTYEDAAPTGTTVKASPASITFPDNTVEVGTDEATSTITLSNGYAPYGNYLDGWFEDLSDKDHCDFYVNDAYAYSYTTSGNATPTLTFSYLADAAGTYTGNFIIQGYNSNYDAVNCTIPLSVTLTSSCANSVAIATGSPTNCTISANAASVSTCSGSRQVTISVTPNSCYAAPVKASVTSTGTTATWVSGPTLNADHYDYVYSFAENATGTATFNASLSTKTTYAISYNAGATTCTGGNAITGSHADDTKTCGTNLTLPGVVFTTTGYTQDGWATSDGGSKVYDLSATNYAKEGDATLYPHWTANKYTVTWSVNGSTYTTTENVTYNTTTSTPANPSVPGECTGSTFMGWTENSSWASDSAPGDLFNGTTPTITGNKTFYAVFADEN